MPTLASTGQFGRPMSVGRRLMIECVNALIGLGTQGIYRPRLDPQCAPVMP